MRRANIVISAIILIIAAYIIFEAISMKYLNNNVPGPGFVPLWTGGAMIVVSLILLYKNAIMKKPETDETPDFNQEVYRNLSVIIGGSVVAMLLVYVIGMLPAIGLLTGFLSWQLGTKSKVTNIALVILTPIIFWLLFEVALEVSFPGGMMGF